MEKTSTTEWSTMLLPCSVANVTRTSASTREQSVTSILLANMLSVLFSNTQPSIEIDSLCGGIDFNTSITHAQFEELNADPFFGTLDPVEKALDDAKLNKSQIHDLLSWWVVLPISPMFNNLYKTSSVRRKLIRASTLVKLLLMV